MNGKTGLVVVALAFCLAWPARACEEDPDTRVQVRDITIICETGNMAWLFREFAKKPEKAACSLVKQLRTTSVREIYRHERDKKKEARDQIWRIRALDYLTCDNGFSAVIPYRRMKVREPYDYWGWIGGNAADHKKPGDWVEVNFYGTWRSHGADYIAPEDAQRQIIRKWRAWQAANGATTGCAPSEEDFMDWSF